MTISRAKYEDLKARNAELEQRLNWLMEFGSSSERISEESMEQLSLLFNEAEVYVDQEKSEPTPVAAHGARKEAAASGISCLRTSRLSL